MDQMDADEERPSLVFVLQDEIELNEWLFGFPIDTYFGSTVNISKCISCFEGEYLKELTRPLNWLFPFFQNPVQIKTGASGLFQVVDNYDPHLKHEAALSRSYDFEYAAITYCDYSKVSPNRSSHQLNGKKWVVSCAC